MSNLFSRLLDERKRLGLSQEAFGALAGVTKFTQLNYEKGSRKPDTDYLTALAAAGIDVPFLLTGARSFDPCATTHSTPAVTLPARLTQERKRMGLTIGQLAEKAGVERLALQKWEDGEFPPTAPELQRLHAAGVDVAYVLLALGASAAVGTAAADEEELLRTYRAAPNDQAKTIARAVLAAAVDSYLPAK